MPDSSRGEEHSRALPVRKQIYAVTGIAATALLIVVLYIALGSGSGRSQTPDQAAGPRLARYVPTTQQLASFNLQTVALRLFHTDVVTDGYVAPNGGLAAAGLSPNAPIEHGLPVLSGQSSDVLQAESDLVTASAQFRAAQANEQRQHKLYETDGAALKDWQQSQVDLASAAASLASARSRLRLLGKTEAAMAVFEGEPSSARQAGGPGTVFSVGDLSTVWLIANVREADAGLVHLGDKIQVRIPAYPHDLFRATVDYVAPMIDPVTHRLVVGAKVHNAGNRLKPNMLATFTITAGEPSEAPAIPRDAIVYEGDMARVWVAGQDGRLSLREITVGRTNGDYTEVIKGLSAGERIVTSGALFIDQAAHNG